MTTAPVPVRTIRLYMVRTPRGFKEYEATSSQEARRQAAEDTGSWAHLLTVASIRTVVAA
jgi:hypothetical protein